MSSDMISPRDMSDDSHAASRRVMARRPGWGAVSIERGFVCGQFREEAVPLTFPLSFQALHVCP
jgi:hypothetical protein